MRSPVRALAGALIAFGSIAACSVDKAGLGGIDAGAGGSAGSAAGTGGGAAGRGGTSGVAGATGGRGGAGGIGVAGMGVAGTGGPGGAGAGVAGSGGIAGVGGNGAAGAAGTTAVAGSGGTSDVAGHGGGPAGAGMAGAGMAGAGMAGAGGTPDPTCGPNNCSNGCCREGQCVTNRSDQACGAAGAACQACGNCFRCGMQDTCEPRPSARWTVICQSAVIAATKPNGSTWDAPPPATSGAAPDTFCEMTIDGNSGETTFVNDSLTPMWNQPVNPNDGENVTASLLMSSQNRWRIAIIDRDISPPNSTENVCQTMPRLTADDLQRGTVSLTAGSCTQINLGFACDEN